MARQARALSDRQRRVLTFFREALRETGTPPTVRQVMKKCGLKSPRGAQLQLRALVDGGLLVHEPMRKPAYRPRPRTLGATLPIVGSAPAGHPADNPEDHRGEVHVPWKVHRAAFAIYVQGDSMEDAQILDGDIAIVEPTNDPVDGEIVLALIEGGSTIKRFRGDRSDWRLEPANKRYSVRVPRMDGDAVIGRVVGILRRLVRVA